MCMHACMCILARMHAYESTHVLMHACIHAGMYLHTHCQKPRPPGRCPLRRSQWDRCALTRSELSGHPRRLMARPLLPVQGCPCRACERSRRYYEERDRHSRSPRRRGAASRDQRSPHRRMDENQPQQTGTSTSTHPPTDHHTEDRQEDEEDDGEEYRHLSPQPRLRVFADSLSPGEVVTIRWGSATIRTQILDVEVRPTGPQWQGGQG